MNIRPLVVITTRLPPQVCGIGTYSWELQQHWPEPERRVEFLVMDEAAEPPGRAATAFHGEGSQLKRLLARVGAADVVLHYSGRGYHRLGCPLWLPSVLGEWKKQHPTARLLVFFHEVPGRGLRFISPHFWLGQINGTIVRRLATLADVVVTNTADHASTLARLSGGKPVSFLPVASNIERVAVPEQRCAAGEFVVFGMSFGRLQTLQAFQPYVPQWHAAGRLARLHVIGPAGDEFTRAADQLMTAWPQSIDIVRHGMSRSEDVSRLLQQARFALTNVNEATWSKSGTFMACAIHRCAVVIAGSRGTAEPLSHVISAEEVHSIGDAEVDRRTAALAEWAEANASWPVISTRFATLLAGGSSNGE